MRANLPQRKGALRRICEQGGGQLGVALLGLQTHVTPLFYTYLDELQSWFAARGKRQRGAAPTLTTASASD